MKNSFFTKIKIYAVLILCLFFTFTYQTNAAKTDEDIKYHLRERHDINFLTPYQFITLFKYIHRNDSNFVANYGAVTIDDLVIFAETKNKSKRKGVCFNQNETSTDEGWNKIYGYIEGIANMTSINDYWVTSSERTIIPQNILQINGNRGGYVIGVWIEQTEGLQTAFPDGYPDGNGRDLGIGMSLKSVKTFYNLMKKSDEAKIKKMFNDSLDWSRKIYISDPKKMEGLNTAYKLAAGKLIKDRVLNKLDSKDKYVR